MPKKPSLPEPTLPEIVVERAMETVMHESMLPYSEFVILERALPRVEDGLKPVQRRILYTMNELALAPDKPHRKCARIVGDCLGKYHPHGDTSVYDALTRMAQNFAMRTPLVDGHGNFGSLDGDSPAAMRYTEARMTPLATEMLRDIEKDTVGFHFNFDDTQKEPDVLPARYPNLLVNGASGIAVGLATNIPPHNLGEVISGVIAQLQNPDITTQALMAYIPAPDFPTGGVLACDEELRAAYETGRGKLKLRAALHIEEGNAGRKQIVITEVPYQVNKAAMLEKILRLSEEKKGVLSSIYDIRDESDRTGLRAVIELRKDADVEATLAALYKYADLQVTFGVNMVCIAEGKPVLMGLKTMIAHYIRHQKAVVTRRTKYDLAQLRARAHILEGLMIALDHLDEVIRMIRQSANGKAAREALMGRFALSEGQAQAILDMRLQRLTNLEVLTLQKEYDATRKQIGTLEGILQSEKKLLQVIASELQALQKKYEDPRRTALVEAFDEREIVEEAPPAENAVVFMTEAGFMKRMSPKAYEKLSASENAEVPAHFLPCTTDSRMLCFTNLGNLFNLPVTAVPECKPKDRGLPPSGLLPGLQPEEVIVSLLMIAANDWTGELLFVTHGGLVKRTALGEYNARKTKIAAIGLKASDALLSVLRIGDETNVTLFTQLGMAIHFRLEEVSCLGRTAAGVKGITLSPGDRVLSALLHNEEGEALIIGHKGYMKRCLLLDFDLQARGGKGVRAMALTKDGGSELASVQRVTTPFVFVVRQKSGLTVTLSTDQVKIERRDTRGTMYALCVIDDVIESVRRVP